MQCLGTQVMCCTRSNFAF